MQLYPFSYTSVHYEDHVTLFGIVELLESYKVLERDFARFLNGRLH